MEFSALIPVDFVFCSIYFVYRRAGDDNHLELLW